MRIYDVCWNNHVVTRRRDGHRRLYLCTCLRARARGCVCVCVSPWTRIDRKERIALARSRMEFGSYKGTGPRIRVRRRAELGRRLTRRLSLVAKMPAAILSKANQPEPRPVEITAIAPDKTQLTVSKMLRWFINVRFYRPNDNPLWAFNLIRDRKIWCRNKLYIYVMIFCIL